MISTQIAHRPCVGDEIDALFADMLPTAWPPMQELGVLADALALRQFRGMSNSSLADRFDSTLIAAGRIVVQQLQDGGRQGDGNDRSQLPIYRLVRLGSDRIGRQQLSSAERRDALRELATALDRDARQLRDLERFPRLFVEIEAAWKVFGIERPAGPTKEIAVTPPALAPHAQIALKPIEHRPQDWRDSRGWWADAAKARMRELRAAGMTDPQIGSLFKLSRQALQSVIKTKQQAAAAAVDSAHGRGVKRRQT